MTTTVTKFQTDEARVFQIPALQALIKHRHGFNLVLFSSPLIINLIAAKNQAITPFLKNFIFKPRLRHINLDKKDTQL